jgi:hypothetical protein
MAEITIRFRRDGKTGKREIVVHLESDPDALPHEHEQDHRRMVEQLSGLKLGEDLGDIVIERVPAEGTKTGEVQPEAPVPQREAEKNRG